MPFFRTVLLGAFVLGQPLALAAADFSDPTWPCVQRKVGALSEGLMWPQPLDPEFQPEDPAVAAEISDLAETLALRRLDVESLAPDVQAFAEKNGGDPQILGQVFAQAFKSLNTRRTRIISGIEDFSLGQIALAEKIDKMRVEMDTELAVAEPDFDRVDALEEQLDWDQTIYSDRQRSITYLCETPVTLERRLFAIAQMLQAVVASDG